MGDLTENECLEYATTLLAETQKLRDEAGDRRDVYNLREEPRLPHDLQKHRVNILSSDPYDEEMKVRATRLGFVTDVQCRATEKARQDGEIKNQYKRGADRIEAAGAMWLRALDPNRHTESSQIWRQNIEGLGCTILECGGINSADPYDRMVWSLYDIDLDGVGFFESGGLPSVAARRYEQMFSIVQERYSGRDDTTEPGAMVSRDESGKVEWKPVTEGFSARGAPAAGRAPGTSSGKFQKCEMVWLDDGARIYHVVLNRQPDAKVQIGPVRIGKSDTYGGKLVYVCDNPFGRVSMFLTSGNNTPQSLTQDRHFPYLHALTSTTSQMNVVTTMRGSRSQARAAPHKYIQADPQSLGPYLTMNNGVMPPDLVWSNDANQVPLLMGEILGEPQNEDDDLDKQELMLSGRLLAYRNSANATLRDPQVIKDITAAAYISTAEIAQQDLAPATSAWNNTLRQYLEAWEHSICYHYAKLDGDQNGGKGKNGKPLPDSTYKFARFAQTASGDDSIQAGGKNIKQGQDVEITPASFAFKHEWRVTSRSNTLAQQQNLAQLARDNMAPLADGRPGPGLYEDLFEAMGVSDIGERVMQLAVEGMTAAFVPQLEEWASQAAAAKIEADSEIRVGLLGVDGNQALNIASQEDPNVTPPAQDTRGTLELPGGGNGTGLQPPPSEPAMSTSGTPVQGG